MNKPNLLFIMTDQQRFDGLGANGNDIIQTPNLDALANSGANLQEYFTNCPVCVPSRCTLFTGRYPHSHGVKENYNVLEPGREFHLFRVLKQTGYKLGYCGKNHLLEKPEFENFDYTGYVFPEDKSPEEDVLMEKYSAQKNEKSEAGKREIWRAGFVHNEPVQASSAWQAAEAGRTFLNGYDSDDPFCLCVSFKDPHVPHMAFQEYFDKYPLDKIELYPEREGEIEEKARRWAIKQGAMNTTIATEEERKRYIAIYYAMISWIDTQVGTLIDLLKERGLDDNTIVVFTTDHGEFAFEHGIAKKDLVLVDTLLHVPFLISWPGHIAPKKHSGTFMEQVDVVPTLLELMDIETPFCVQGTSFAPVLKGETAEHKDAVFAEINPPYLFNKYESLDRFIDAHGGREKVPFNVPGDFTKSIRERDWRYVWYLDGSEELYDHRSDPLEQYNVADKPEHAEVKNRLKMRLLEWCALTEDPLDLNGRRFLQSVYPDWMPNTIPEGTPHGPSWVETRHMPKPRKP